MTNNLYQFIEPCCEIAKQAGTAIMQIYHASEQADFSIKADGSPLTIADQTADNIISQGLSKLTPLLPILSEESADVTYSERANWQRYWLVDPLDGTKEFIHRTGDFTVNIALIEGQHAVLGIVYNPVTRELYYATHGNQAFKINLDKNSTPHAISTQMLASGRPLRIIGSRRHNNRAVEQLLNQFPNAELIQRGSSLKFCMVAEGNADLYPRLGITSEWDTAAAQCILEAAGGAVLDFEGLPLRYNTRDSLQNPEFFAVGDKTHNWLELLAST